VGSIAADDSGRRTGGERVGGFSLHAPAIDPERCTGCDACARICPHQVFRVESAAYRLDADGCTGCGLCVDVCTAAAIRIRSPAPSPETRTALHAARCTACGALFHVPKAGATRCPVCLKARHHERLFQVLQP
jgi:Pyruvate/2-oxoacid:ferredoxin oxidoreductase delta subunit